jgi:hypothetical protein
MGLIERQEASLKRALREPQESLKRALRDGWASFNAKRRAFREP